MKTFKFLILLTSLALTLSTSSTLDATKRPAPDAYTSGDEGVSFSDEEDECVVQSDPNNKFDYNPWVHLTGKEFEQPV